MPVRTICLAVLAFGCLAAAYRFGSHGIMLRDNFCVGLAGVSIALAAGLLGIEVWIRQAKPRSSQYVNPADYPGNQGK
jgi:hypothetical protein